MVIKVYCLVVSGGEYEDMEITLSLDKAMEWLKKRPNTRQVIEYLVSEDAITKRWHGLWNCDAAGNLTFSE